MIKIIETHLSLDNDNIIRDHQSRVIEYDSWDEYIELIKSEKYKLVNGTMDGCILPRSAKVENLIFDDFHLSCDVLTAVNTRIMKFAYKVNANI